MGDGTKKEAKDIVAGDSVLTVNEFTDEIEPQKVTATLNNGVREVIRISTEKRSIICTHNHPFMIFADHRWVEAGDLTVGECVMVANDDNTSLEIEVVTGVEEVGEIETIDIEVEKNHNFIANGFITHNTALSKIEILREAVKPNRYIWYVAPTYRMAKQIMWFDLLDAIPRDWVVKQNDTFLTLKLVNGTRIELKGADSPDTLRGVGLNFLVLDEFQDMTRETWTQVLRPTLSDKMGRALFIGCVRGDTKILTKSGFTNIDRVCSGTKSKTFTPIDLDLYGINREFHKADNF